MLVTLALRGMQFHAFHGCLEVERELGQIFSINVGMDYELSPEEADNPEAVPSYQEVFERVQHVVMGRKFRTLEALGWGIGKAILEAYPFVEDVYVDVSSNQLFVPGLIDSKVVTVSLDREELEG
ncbi:dihydroneopterin aldolase [Acetomicrobium sp. S15 = DSM 107314]|jgi:dihydroneopterin aldolase|uniref:dihydroneopterin aldolase n=1 Tax=Acetomicrobium sp. S15 = DSM 107314 TaxID=2529858 RepID=UPI0018E1975E|nr:dihydroneopterin aldolase [Acetomicrobium sp. S15 = DSM 107314]